MCIRGRYAILGKRATPYDRWTASDMNRRRWRSGLFCVIVALTLLALFSDEQSVFARKARRNPVHSAEAWLDTVSSALGQFGQDVGRFPSTAEGLDALVRRPSSVSPQAWKGPYLRRAQIPMDSWGHTWIYRCPGNHNPHSFDLHSVGADGLSMSNGDDRDDINNWNLDRPSRVRYKRGRIRQWAEPVVLAIVGAGLVLWLVSAIRMARPSKASITCFIAGLVSLGLMGLEVFDGGCVLGPLILVSGAIALLGIRFGGKALGALSDRKDISGKRLAVAGLIMSGICLLIALDVWV